MRFSKKYLLVAVLATKSVGLLCESPGQVLQDARDTIASQREPVGEVEFTKIEIAALLGDAGAMVLLGNIYSDDVSGRKDLAKAYAWYEKAAQKESLVGELCVAKCYYSGTGVKQDYSKAFYWFEKAAAQGSAEAQAQLARMLRDGAGAVKKDLKKALEWVKKAAEQGYAGSQEMLSDISRGLEEAKSALTS